MLFLEKCYRSCTYFRWLFQIEAAEKRRQRVKELLSKQHDLKYELLSAKSLLMVESTSWSFDRKFTQVQPAI